MPDRSSRDNIVWLIGLFKLAKGALLLLLGIGVLKLINKDIAEVAERWINLVRVDPDNRYVNAALMKLYSWDDKKLKEISAGIFIYAGVFSTEGVGLLLNKRWASYFTIIVMSSFMPFEVYEMAKHPSVMKGGAIALNVAIVCYLIVKSRRDRLKLSRRVG